MRQIGHPPRIDLEIAGIAGRVFGQRAIQTIDATGSTGSKDFLELIRATGFTVAVFSNETKPTAMANIALELGFAAMCGKPLLILKSKDAVVPSDLTRTDWIEYEPSEASVFEQKLHQAVDDIESLHGLEATLIDVTLEAARPDCAVAQERVKKGFLLSGDPRFIARSAKILGLLEKVQEGDRIADLDRQRSEVRTFLRQAESSIGIAATPGSVEKGASD